MKQFKLADLREAPLSMEPLFYNSMHFFLKIYVLNVLTGSWPLFRITLLEQISRFTDLHQSTDRRTPQLLLKNESFTTVK